VLVNAAYFMKRTISLFRLVFALFIGVSFGIGLRSAVAVPDVNDLHRALNLRNPYLYVFYLTEILKQERINLFNEMNSAQFIANEPLLSVDDFRGLLNHSMSPEFHDCFMRKTLRYFHEFYPGRLPPYIDPESGSLTFSGIKQELKRRLGSIHYPNLTLSTFDEVKVFLKNWITLSSDLNPQSVGIFFNHQPNGKHWSLVYVFKRDTRWVVKVFDAALTPVGREFVDRLQALSGPLGFDLVQVDRNNERRQFDGTTCSMFAIHDFVQVSQNPSYGEVVSLPFMQLIQSRTAVGRRLGEGTPQFRAFWDEVARESHLAVIPAWGASFLNEGLGFSGSVLNGGVLAGQGDRVRDDLIDQWQNIILQVPEYQLIKNRRPLTWYPLWQDVNRECELSDGIPHAFYPTTSTSVNATARHQYAEAVNALLNLRVEEDQARLEALLRH
jgi:hypothetical protein